MVALVSNLEEKNFSIDASINLKGKYLVMNYCITGDLSSIIVQNPVESPLRCYDLWEHTCFEAFLKQPESDWYIEFNFAPSQDWNCFYVSSYRKNEGEYSAVKEVEITQKRSENELQLVAQVDYSPLELFDFKEKKEYEVGLTAITESRSDELNYWCFKRLDGAPDFHNHSTFKRIIL